MDHRAVRLALGLTIAGASMLTAGVATWLITAVGGMTSGMAARDLRLAALALLAGGVACGVAMGFALAAAGRTRAGRRAGPAGGAGPAPGAQAAAGPGPVPGRAPVPDEPAAAHPAAAAGPPPRARRRRARAPPDRVWWRAPHSPASSWDDTSEEWLRSLRGPAIQQPPPHSAEYPVLPAPPPAPARCCR